MLSLTLSTLANVENYRHDKVKEHAEFIIDETFGVPGVGTVIAGTVKRGVITTNANLMLGPDVGDGTFKSTAIKSIQYKRLPVTRVGITCCLLAPSPVSVTSPQIIGVKFGFGSSRSLPVSPAWDCDHSTLPLLMV